MAATSSTPAPFQAGFALQDGSALNAALAAPGWSVQAGQTALGAALASAFPLEATITQFSTVAAGTGAYLLATMVPGQFRDVYNDGAQTLTVYAAGGATIDGTAGATGVSLSSTHRCRYTCLAPGVFESALLGAVSS
jgi:hypothetical protein